MNADGSGQRRLLTMEAWSPAWSPDGTSIAFVSDQSGSDDIYTVAADGSNVAQLTDNRGIADEAPTWSPDSSQLAFASDRDGDADIFVMRADGSDTHVVVPGVWTDSDPAWRP